MKAPFSTKDLDSLLNACIQFSEHHGPHFYTGNIGGREGVPTDDDVVQRMFVWIAGTDKDLLEDCGFGKDNIHYFRLGHHATDVMTDGGFAKYLRMRTLAEHLANLRLWAPIGISVVAVTVSVFALNKPLEVTDRVDELRSQLLELHAEQEQLKAAIEKLSNTQEELPSHDVFPNLPESRGPLSDDALLPAPVERTPAER